MKHIMPTLSFEERLSVCNTFSEYKMLLAKTKYAIRNIQADTELYERTTFDFDRAKMLRDPSDTIDVQRLLPLCEEVNALQQKVRQLHALVEQKGKKQMKSVDEVTNNLKEMLDSLINICQILSDHKSSGHAMNRVLRYDAALGREVYCYIDPEFISKLGQTKDYIEDCFDKVKKF